MTTKELTCKAGKPRAASLLSAEELKAMEQKQTAKARALAETTRLSLVGAQWGYRLSKAIVVKKQNFAQACLTADAGGSRGRLAGHPLSLGAR